MSWFILRCIFYRSKMGLGTFNQKFRRSICTQFVQCERGLGHVLGTIWAQIRNCAQTHDFEPSNLEQRLR